MRPDYSVARARASRGRAQADRHRIRCTGRSHERHRPPAGRAWTGSEGTGIDFKALTTLCRSAIRCRKDAIIIEGIGGIMVPLDERRTVLDWMIEIGLPAILVAGSYVGTLSHTLSALDVLARHKLKVAAVVVSETPGSAATLADTADTIRRFAANIEVFALPRLPEGTCDHPVMAALADLM
jgi:dethiobiotin synthetase